MNSFPFQELPDELQLETITHASSRSCATRLCLALACHRLFHLLRKGITFEKVSNSICEEGLSSLVPWALEELDLFFHPADLALAASNGDLNFFTTLLSHPHIKEKRRYSLSGRLLAPSEPYRPRLALSRIRPGVYSSPLSNSPNLLLITSSGYNQSIDCAKMRYNSPLPRTFLPMPPF